MMGSSDQFMEINELHTVYTDPTKFDLISDDIIRFYICVFFWENNGINITHDGSMVRLYINANIKGFFVDGIHVTIYSSTMDPMSNGTSNGFHIPYQPTSVHRSNDAKSQKKIDLFHMPYFFRYSL